MDIRDIDEVVLSQFIERLLKSKEIPLQSVTGYDRICQWCIQKISQRRDYQKRVTTRVMKLTFHCTNNIVSVKQLKHQQKEHSRRKRKK